MKEIGLLQAKSNLAKIAATVRRTGEAVTLTRKGEPYVDLVPHQPAATPPRRSKREVLDAMDELRRQLPPATLAEIKRDIAEGRH